MDADETLLDFPYEEREGLYLALREFGVTPTEAHATRFHAINHQMWKALERGEITREELIVKRFELLFAEFSLPIDAEQFSKAYFQTLANGGRLYEGAREFILSLKARGRVYIVTNGSAIVQHARIKNTGLIDLVDGHFISEEIGAYKPSERYAEWVENAIPYYRRENAVWIGDSLTSDCVCARSRAIDFILFAPSGAPAGYEGAFATSYQEILSQLEQR